MSYSNPHMTPNHVNPLDTLPDTLAQRVRYLRDVRDMTQRQLAAKAIVDVDLIQDIETGIELYLSPAVRQKIARSLGVLSEVIKEVEKVPPAEHHTVIEERQTKSVGLLDAIQRNHKGNYFCPDCGGSILVRIFNRRDMNDDPIDAIKANCTQCLFRLESEV